MSQVAGSDGQHIVFGQLSRVNLFTSGLATSVNFVLVVLGLGSGPEVGRLRPTVAVAPPRLSEAWFCCAEPTGSQLSLLGAAAQE